MTREERKRAMLNRWAKTERNELAALRPMLGRRAVVWLALRAGGENCRLSAKTVAEVTGVPLRSTHNAIAELVAGGIVQRVMRGDGTEEFTTQIHAGVNAAVHADVKEQAGAVHPGVNEVHSCVTSVHFYGTNVHPGVNENGSANIDSPLQDNAFSSSCAGVEETGEETGEALREAPCESASKAPPADEVPPPAEVPSPTPQPAHATTDTHARSVVAPPALETPCPPPVAPAPPPAPPRVTRALDTPPALNRAAEFDGRDLPTVTVTDAPTGPAAQLALVPDVPAPVKPKRAKKPAATDDPDVVALHALWQQVTGKGWALDADRARMWREVLEKAGGDVERAKTAVRGLGRDDFLMGRQPGKPTAHVEPRVIKSNFDRLHDMGAEAAEAPAAASMNPRDQDRVYQTEIDTLWSECGLITDEAMDAFTEDTTPEMRARYVAAVPLKCGRVEGVFCLAKIDGAGIEAAKIDRLLRALNSGRVVLKRIHEKWGAESDHARIHTVTLNGLQRQLRAMWDALPPPPPPLTDRGPPPRVLREMAAAAALQPITSEVPNV